MTDSPAQELPPPPAVTRSDWGGTDKREVLDYDADTGTYRTSFDPASESAWEAVVATVAAVAETPPLELPPLYGAMDPDVLEALVAPAGDEGGGNEAYVSATFDGYGVTVYDDGIVTVQPLSDDSRPGA